MGKRLMLVAVGALVGFSAVPVFAQTSAMIETLDADHLYNLAADWILDSDPRHRAWAAELIAANNFVTLYPRLVTALNALQPAASPKFTGKPEELALEAVADALIRVNAQIPATNARQLYPEFPALSLILLSRAIDDSEPALLSIAEEAEVPEVWLAAANLLARKPPHEFITNLLDQFHPTVRIMITDPGTGAGMSGDDCYMMPKIQVAVPPDWPEFSVYSLRAEREGKDVIASGPTSIGLVRSEATAAPWTGQRGCGSINLRRARLEVISHLAGVGTHDMKLKDLVDHQVVIESDGQYQRDVIGVVQEQADAFYALVAQLSAKGLLTEVEARERRLHMNVYVVLMGSRHTAPKFPDVRSLGVVAEIHSNP